MKTSDIRSMGLAYLEVLEGKDAVNKHGHDHVGKEDDDVNNDKKVNSTDKYLLNRRKAISANVRKEETEEVDEALVGNQHKIDANKNGKVDSHDFHLLRKRKKVAEEAELDEVSNASKVFNKIAAKAGGGEKGKKMAAGLLNKMKKEEVESVDEVSSKTLGNYSIKAAQQGDKRIAGQKMADDKVRKKYGYSSDAKVAAEATEWPIFARIREKANAMPAGPETKKNDYEISKVGDDFKVDIEMSRIKRQPVNTEPPNSEKNFIDQHGGLNGNDTGHSQSKNAAMNATAATAGVKQAPGRHNDQKIGDKTPPKASS